MRDSAESSALLSQIAEEVGSFNSSGALRIRVCQSLSIPEIVRSADGSAILSINTELSFEDLESFIGEALREGERDVAYSLWADGESERLFIPIPGTSDFFIEFR